MPALIFPDLGFNMVHVDDVADGILLAVDEGKAGEAYVLGGEITTMRGLFETLASRSTASVIRSSGAVSEIRKKPSPDGPYMEPGETTTAASSSTSSANEVEVCPSGTGAQT